MSSGSRASAGRRFVGRAAEVETLLGAIEDARRGAPSVVLIGGEAGMGKSTLLAEAAMRGSVQLLVARCMQLGGEVVPLGPLADLLRQIQRVAPEVLTGAQGLERFAPWLSSGEVATAGPSAEGVFAPVIDLLGRLAQDGVVIVAVEDLHWADAATWDLFDLLARNLFDERLVLVGTYRLDELSRNPALRRRVAEIGRLPTARRLELHGLGREDVAACVAAVTGGVAEAAVVDRILERGGGNPLFTEELARAHVAGEAFPGVLADLIAHELAGLAPSARQVLSAAAAIGNEVAHDLLAAAVDLDASELEGALRVVIEAHLLIVDHGADGYRFRHPLIAEVAYAELLPPQRRRVHRRIAERLQGSTSGAMPMVRAGELALHLDRAGDVPGAFAALLAAADAAETTAPGVALELLERALAMWDDAGDSAASQNRCERLWQAAEVAAGTAGNAHAVTLAREAFRWGIPSRGAAWAHERLGRYLWACGELEASAGEFRAAVEALSADADAPGAAAVMAGLAQAALMDGRLDDADGWCGRVLHDAPSRAPDPVAWLTATRVRGVVAAERGDVAEGLRLCRAAVAAAPSAFARALTTAYLGIVLLLAGEHREAVSVAIDGGSDARLAGLDRSFGAYFDSEALDGLIRLGRWDEADALVAGRHAAGVDAFQPGRVRFVTLAALLAGKRGNGADARAGFDDVRARGVDGFHEPFLACAASEAFLALGWWDEASVEAERGWEATVGNRPLWAVRLAALSVTAAVEQALDAQARRATVDLDAVVRRLERRIEDARAGVLRTVSELPTLAAVQLGHARAALTLLTGPDADAWTAAADGWQALGERWMTADAQLREAEASFALGDVARATSALRQSHAIALDLANPPLLERVEAVARRTRISLEAPEIVSLDRESTDRLGLTPRESEVLGLVAAGWTNRRIGEALYVSEKTASVHVSNILRKLGVASRVDAAAVAQRLGIG